MSVSCQAEPLLLSLNFYSPLHWNEYKVIPLGSVLSRFFPFVFKYLPETLVSEH